METKQTTPSSKMEVTTRALALGLLFVLTTACGKFETIDDKTGAPEVTINETPNPVILNDEEQANDRAGFRRDSSAPEWEEAIPVPPDEPPPPLNIPTPTPKVTEKEESTFPPGPSAQKRQTRPMSPQEAVDEAPMRPVRPNSSTTVPGASKQNAPSVKVEETFPPAPAKKEEKEKKPRWRPGMTKPADQKPVPQPPPSSERPKTTTTPTPTPKPAPEKPAPSQPEQKPAPQPPPRPQNPEPAPQPPERPSEPAAPMPPKVERPEQKPQEKPQEKPRREQPVDKGEQPRSSSPTLSEDDVAEKGFVKPSVYNFIRLNEDRNGCDDSEKVTLHGPKGVALAQVCPKTHEECAMEGSCAVVQNRVSRSFNSLTKVSGQDRFIEIKNECQFGYGVQSACLDPYFTLAADLSVYSPGDVIYIPSIVGTVLPDGSKHRGLFIIRDRGRFIKGPGRFDFFTGFTTWRDPSNAFVKLGLADKKNQTPFYKLKGPRADRFRQERSFPRLPSRPIDDR